MRSHQSRQVHKQTSLSLGSDGRLRIVVVADTHSRPHPSCATHVTALEPDAIFHAGDIGDLHVLDAFAEIAPLTAVRGNIDVHARDLADTITVDIRHGDRVELTMLLLHIAVYGPKLRADAAKLARQAGASLVVCGHSHVPFIGRDRGIAVINAGSCGPRRFQLPIVFGVVDIEKTNVQLWHVNCETGARWEPPG